MSKFLFKDLDTRELAGKNYKSILSFIDLWRRSGGKTDIFNDWSGPVNYYFKPFFYFDNKYGDTNTTRLLGLDVDYQTLGSSLFGIPSMKSDIGFGKGMLHPGRQVGESGTVNGQYDWESGNQIANSAVNFLLQNCEWERAEKLLQFIKLLSNISTFEPWQFQQVSGIDEALNRKYFTSGEFSIEERKSISFKCLPESYNSKIGTLLDLYRDVCFSYKWKKEIIPANLRKFDMGIYIFSQPIRRFHIENVSNDIRKYSSFEIPNSIYNKNNDNVSEPEYYSSVKYIEFLNCEFDYNSNVKSYSDVNNSEGKEMENEIKIFFDECYEMRYNEFILRTIGDLIFQDSDFEGLTGYFQVNNNERKKKLNDRVVFDRSLSNEVELEDLSDGSNKIENISLGGPLGYGKSGADKLKDTITGHAKQKIRNIINGNLSKYNLSLGKINKVTNIVGDIINNPNPLEYGIDLGLNVLNKKLNDNIFHNGLAGVKLPRSMPPEKRGFVHHKLE